MKKIHRKDQLPQMDLMNGKNFTINIFLMFSSIQESKKGGTKKSSWQFSWFLLE